MKSEHFPAWFNRFVDIYSQLDTSNYHRIADVYADNVLFVDPAHQLNGKAALLAYFDNLYTNLSSCRFTIHNQLVDQDQAAIYWTMSFQHPQLNKGMPVEVEGHSHLKSNGETVVYHRDYIDLGAMLYEHIPLVGRVIKHIKARLAQ